MFVVYKPPDPAPPFLGNPSSIPSPRNEGGKQIAIRAGRWSSRVCYLRNAGGFLVLAHPNDPNGTSLASITGDLERQTAIIEEHMLGYIDGIECWHSRSDARTTAHYIEFARKHNLLMTGGSDCHQKPVLMGTLDIPDRVAGQFQ